MKNLILVLALLVLLTHTRNIQAHLDSASYLRQYKEKQSQFQSILRNLDNDIDQTKKDVNKQTDLDAQIQKLQSSIVRQKKLLNQASLELIPPINQIDWKCATLQGTTLDELKGLAGDLDDQTNKLSGNIAQLNGKQTPQSVQNAIAGALYADAIKKSLNPKIDFYDPNNTKIGYVSDLSGNKWTPGGLTPEDIQKNTKETKQNNDVVKTCPATTPFFNGQNCIQCDPNQIFNLQINACFSCTDFNPEGRQCLSSSGNYDGTNVDEGQPRLILPSGVTPSQIKKGIKNPCPRDRPFFADNYCIECDASAPLFDYSQEECTNCEQGYIYSSEQYKCLQKPVYDNNYPVAKDRIIIPEGQTLTDLERKQAERAEKQNLIFCEEKTPFYNTKQKKCLQCPEGSYFNMEKNQCQKCPDGLIYYIPAHRCLNSPIYSNLANQNWTSINPKKTKEDIQTTKKMQYSQECPLKTPFFNGNQCIKCPPNQIFSFDTEQCTECEKGTFFSKNLHQCLKPEGDYQTNPKTAPNLIYGGVSKAEWVNRYYQNQEKTPGIADCPEKKPYFQGVVCIDCPDDHPYFNMYYQMCQSCQNDSNYNEKIRECLNVGGQIIDQTPNLQKMAAGVFT